MNAKITGWLKDHGLFFNPFEPLQADRDTRLWMYWVGNLEVFQVAWEPQAALLLAPWGGGKSALRARLTQECWATPVEARPFPLVYFPGGLYADLTSYLSEIAANGTRELLLALARHPRYFLEASPRSQKAFADFLSAVLPLAAFGLDQMVEEGSLAPLNRPYDPGYDLEIPREERGDWLAFALALRNLLPATASPLEPAAQWAELLFWIKELLHRPRVYVLVDGLDAWPDTARDPVSLFQAATPFLKAVPEWAQQGCFLKLFLPAAIKPLLTPELSSPQLSCGEISWSAPLLSQVLQRRMIAASRGRLDALAALAEPALASLDEQLVQAVPLLPRELLVLVNRILETHAQAAAPRLEGACVAACLNHYHEEIMNGPYATSL